MRNIFLCAIILCVAFSANVVAKEVHLKAGDSLKILKAGNARFVESKLIHPNQSLERRNELVAGQAPKAVVISCSDSRVPPELVFDQGLGDLFVVRVAGNILNNENIGSVEYAVEHTGAPLVVVLGHKKCGAVAAAVKGGDIPGHIKSITDAIEPAVREAKKTAGKGDVAEKAAHINVENVVRALKTSQPILAEELKEGDVKIVGAYYDLDSGKVEWLK